ncbi:Protein TRIGALACTOSYLDIACYLGLYCEROL 1, chloroplastic, partial [Cucurbita argyrosperma subsp. sororia]
MQIACQPHPLVYFSIRSSSKRQDEWKNVQNLHSRSLVKPVFLEPQTHKFARPLCKNRLYAIPHEEDGRPSASMPEDVNSKPMLNSIAEELGNKWSPPRYLWRGLSVLFLTGQVIMRTLKGKIHWKNTLQQLERVGPRSVGVCWWCTSSGILKGAKSRDYVNCGCRENWKFIRCRIRNNAIGMASSALLADSVYGISINIIIDSALRALKSWDIISAMIKSQVFGAIISIVSCAWGITTSGGAKGVGESTTSAVVISLVGIFIADFTLSCFFFQGAGDSLKNCM